MPSANPTHDSLAAALVAAQAEFPAVEPDSVNPHFRSKFVSLDHLIAKTRPILNKHGLTISQWPTLLINVVTGDTVPTLTTRLTHSSGEERSSEMPLILQKQDMQGLGAALTYARRYMWAAALGISADEDDDGNQASAPAAKPKPASRIKPAPTPEAAPEGITYDHESLVEDVAAGIARLGPEHGNWTLTGVLNGATQKFGRTIESLDALEDDELLVILAAMPGEQTVLT